MSGNSPFKEKEQVILALRQQQTICSKDVAEDIYEAGQLKTFKRGEYVARQGEQGGSLFYILSGSVQVIVQGHDYKIRHRNELIGEMAVIEPGARRTADLVAVDDDTTLFVVEAADFHRAAAKHGEIWECLAHEIAGRLRQRDTMFVPPNPVPVIFIASSREGLEVVGRLETMLDASDRALRPWNKPGIFKPTRGTLEELERHADEVDFAIIVVTPDDIRESRGTINIVARDNVVLEFGIFMGALKRDRAFLLVQDAPELALASDLEGVTVQYFNDDAELEARVGEIDTQIRLQGPLHRYCKVVA